MIKLKNGTKVKVKKTCKFFAKKIHLTKLGWVWVDKYSHEINTYPSLYEAEQAIIEKKKQCNTNWYTYAYRVRNCMTESDALYEKKLWNHEGSDDSFIHWYRDGGKAVAVKLDSIGKPVDYLSLCDWSNKYKWKLPEGNWHMFHW
jgi:hypothetical protein